MSQRFLWPWAYCLVTAAVAVGSDRVTVDDRTGEFRLASVSSSAGGGGCVTCSDTSCGCQSCSSCNSYGDGCSSCCDEKLFGIFAPSDRCFSSFISPMTNPVFFEDPRTLTEARFIYAHHKVPNRAPLAGGEIQFFAMQLRAALTDRLSVIATKDGFFTFSNEINVAANDGWSDVNAGLKYNLWSDPDCQRLLSAGVTYELPVGSTRAAQGNGDGEFNLFLTGGAQVGAWSHVVSAGGLRLPVDRVDESQVAYWSAHFDTQVPDTCWYLFAEGNWYHWVNSGRRVPLNLEGLDLFNVGSNNVAGNDIVTGAFGLKFKPSQLNEIGIAFEAPLTDRRDVIENRVTFDLIVRY